MAPHKFSNQLKAILVLDNISESGVSVWQNNCFTVQQFSYSCERRRNASGVPYGPTQTSFLSFTVRLPGPDSAKVMLERMKSRETYPFSFLFNATFSEDNSLAECEDAMVATGYLVEAEQAYVGQMLFRGMILLSDISYLGKEKTLELNITND